MISGKAKLGEKLIFAAQTGDREFVVTSTSLLRPSKNSSITANLLTKRFKSFHNESYHLTTVNFSDLNEDLSVPFKEINVMKKDLAFILNGSVEHVPPIEVPKLAQNPKVEAKPKLSLLISDEKDAHLSDFPRHEPA